MQYHTIITLPNSTSINSPNNALNIRRTQRLKNRYLKKNINVLIEETNILHTPNDNGNYATNLNGIDNEYNNFNIENEINSSTKNVATQRGKDEENKHLLEEEEEKN